MLKVQINDISNSFLVNDDCHLYAQVQDDLWIHVAQSPDEHWSGGCGGHCEPTRLWGWCSVWPHQAIRENASHALHAGARESRAHPHLSAVLTEGDRHSLFTFLSLSVNFLGHFRSLSISVVYCCSWDSSASCLSLPSPLSFLCFLALCSCLT